MKRLIASFLIVVTYLAVAAGAQAQVEAESVTLPDRVMKRVVERIVIEHFRSRGKGEIYFSEQNIKREWLPKIRKIEFVFVEEADGREVHFFDDLVRIGETYEINFGWGDPECAAEGNTWQFRIVRDTITNIARTSGGWGTGCSASH